MLKFKITLWGPLSALLNKKQEFVTIIEEKTWQGTSVRKILLWSEFLPIFFATICGKFYKK